MKKVKRQLMATKMTPIVKNFNRLPKREFMRFFFVGIVLLISFSASAEFYGSCDDPDNHYCTEFVGSGYADPDQRADYCALGSGNGKLSDAQCARELRPGCRFNAKQENENILYGYGNVREVLSLVCKQLGGELYP